MTSIIFAIALVTVLVALDAASGGERPLSFLVGSLVPVIEALMVVVVLAAVLAVLGSATAGWFRHDPFGAVDIEPRWAGGDPQVVIDLERDVYDAIHGFLQCVMRLPQPVGVPQCWQNYAKVSDKMRAAGCCLQARPGLTQASCGILGA